MHRICVIAAPTEPPEAKNAISPAGVVHGVLTTSLPQKPMVVMKYAKADVTKGASINGIARNGLSTTGRPKITGSLILKIAQGIASLAIAL
jgi:hypothetical protein